MLSVACAALTQASDRPVAPPAAYRMSIVLGEVLDIFDTPRSSQALHNAQQQLLLSEVLL